MTHYASKMFLELDAQISRALALQKEDSEEGGLPDYDVAKIHKYSTPGKSSRPKPQKKGSSDDFQTPPSALNPLLPHLGKFFNIWEPAAGRGNLVNAFNEKGWICKGTDVLTGQDFLKYEPDFEWECLITNPPYSIKDEFLARCFWWGKPFALLLPFTALEGQKRQPLYRKHHIELIFFPNSIQFPAMWLTCELEIGQQLTFSE